MVYDVQKSRVVRFRLTLGFERVSDRKGESAVWISKIKISNFKSLVDFEIDLAKFNCLIGLNGSGKSTVLQAIDFLAQLIRGDMKGWLRKRRWRPEELTSQLLNSNRIGFSVEFDEFDLQVNIREKLIWSGQYDIVEQYCIVERFETENRFVAVEDNELKWPEGDLDPEFKLSPNPVPQSKIVWKYQGSVFSSFTPAYPRWAFGIKSQLDYYFKSLRSLEMLSPNLLRRRSERAPYEIGLGGEGFSLYLSMLGPEKRSRILDRLQQIYPRIMAIETESLPSGRGRVKIRENFGSEGFVTQAHHVNDGLLRMTALFALLEGRYQFLLFDEIENGINPELVKFVIETLTQAQQQILVTTHSPVILNFLEDDMARQSVIYLDKRENGTTRATPFFKIPSVDRKLSVMGPGEAFVDTDLLHLGDEIDRMAESR